jgi:hypothetical protein
MTVAGEASSTVHEVGDINWCQGAGPRGIQSRVGQVSGEVLVKEAEVDDDVE